MDDAFRNKIDKLADIPTGYGFFKKGSIQHHAVLKLADAARPFSSVLPVEEIDRITEVALSDFSEGQDGWGAIMQLANFAKERRGESRNNLYEKARQEGIDCVTSLYQSIQEAGGRVHEDCLDMTLREFISKIASQNNIRFTYTGPR